jgi:polysaccharide export outer membrane protein
MKIVTALIQSMHRVLLCMLVVTCAMSCRSHKQDVMFRVDDVSVLSKQKEVVERQYTIQPFDQIVLEVYTNNGERLIDPDAYLQKGQSTPKVTEEGSPNDTYSIDESGRVKLPMVGEIMVKDLTIRQAEEVLQESYNHFYKDAFIRLKSNSRRVVVLGTIGGEVIPLKFEHMKVTEVLALSKSVIKDAKAHNIRLLRGKDVYVIDFSTVEGYVNTDMLVESGDIVYVEPVRRPVENLRDYMPVISVMSSFITVVVVLLSQQ